MIVNIVYRGCVVTRIYRELLVDLVLIATLDFDVILRMDWLATYDAFIDYFEKCVMFKLSGALEVGV